MKQFLLMALVCIVFAACQNNPEGDKAKTTSAVDSTANTAGMELMIDTAQSTIKWTGRKVTGQHTGTVKINSGSVFLNDGQLSGGTFIIGMNSISNTDLNGDADSKAKLEGHLKSADFFDTEKHPTSTFEITSVKDLGNNKVSISGNLTMRGVSKNVTFDATITEVAETVFKASADFNINRKDWGVAYKGMQDDLISDEINFKINLVAGG